MRNAAYVWDVHIHRDPMRDSRKTQPFGLRSCFPEVAKNLHLAGNSEVFQTHTMRCWSETEKSSGRVQVGAEVELVLERLYLDENENEVITWKFRPI